MDEARTFLAVVYAGLSLATGVIHARNGMRLRDAKRGLRFFTAGVAFLVSLSLAVSLLGLVSREASGIVTTVGLFMLLVALLALGAVEL